MYTQRTSKSCHRNGQSTKQMERNPMFMDGKIVKVSMPPKATYRFNVTTNGIVQRYRKDNPKICTGTTKTQE